MRGRLLLSLGSLGYALLYAGTVTAILYVRFRIQISSAPPEHIASLRSMYALETTDGVIINLILFFPVHLVVLHLTKRRWSGLGLAKCFVASSMAGSIAAAGVAALIWASEDAQMRGSVPDAVIFLLVVAYAGGAATLIAFGFVRHLQSRRAR